jgi:hypothetical protein
MLRDITLALFLLASLYARRESKLTSHVTTIVTASLFHALADLVLPATPIVFVAEFLSRLPQTTEKSARLLRVEAFLLFWLSIISGLSFFACRKLLGSTYHAVWKTRDVLGTL